MQVNKFDVIIVGGSYSGLAAGMALGRALLKVLIIDDGNPCNRQTPYSHNFITNDGKPPAEIARIAKQQVQVYDTITFLSGRATAAFAGENSFTIEVDFDKTFEAGKLVFATGIKDLLPPINGLDTCWGISVLHCPYCHGYEVRNQQTGILANGDMAYDLARLIFNWTKQLTVFTNGRSTLTQAQVESLGRRNISVVQNEIDGLLHSNGYIEAIRFKDGSKFLLKALYVPAPFEQHCTLPAYLGCQVNEGGYLQVDAFQQTTVHGVYACGDNTTRMRTVANAVAMGTTAGMSLSKEMILGEF